MDDQQQFGIYFGDILLWRLEITPAVLVAVIDNEEAGPEFLNMFLERCHGDPLLSDSVLKSAIDNHFFRMMIMASKFGNIWKNRWPSLDFLSRQVSYCMSAPWQTFKNSWGFFRIGLSVISPWPLLRGALREFSNRVSI
jgi:hypothetical protein